MRGRYRSQKRASILRLLNGERRVRKIRNTPEHKNRLGDGFGPFCGFACKPDRLRDRFGEVLQALYVLSDNPYELPGRTSGLFWPPCSRDRMPSRITRPGRRRKSDVPSKRTSTGATWSRSSRCRPPSLRRAKRKLPGSLGAEGLAYEYGPRVDGRSISLPQIPEVHERIDRFAALL